MVDPSILKGLDNKILYRRPDLERLGNVLLDMWEAQDTDDRCAEIEYLVQDEKCDLTYTSPSEIDPDENPADRRDRLVRRHFGDEPIVYPPWSPEDNGPDYQL